jgi:hypothetical protein
MCFSVNIKTRFRRIWFIMLQLINWFALFFAGKRRSVSCLAVYRTGTLLVSTICCYVCVTLWDFRFSHSWGWRCSCRVWRLVDSRVDANDSEKHMVSIFRALKMKVVCSFETLASTCESERRQMSEHHHCLLLVHVCPTFAEQLIFFSDNISKFTVKNDGRI